VPPPFASSAIPVEYLRDASPLICAGVCGFATSLRHLRLVHRRAGALRDRALRDFSRRVNGLLSGDEGLKFRHLVNWKRWLRIDETHERADEQQLPLAVT
jgi:hypothetical protein